MPEPIAEKTITILASRFKEVADLVAENEKLKDALAAFQSAAPQKSFVAEPSGTPLPTEPEPVDEASAADWGDEPATAEPTPKKTAKKK